jgi:hypothetical protein
VLKFTIKLELIIKCAGTHRDDERYIKVISLLNLGHFSAISFGEGKLTLLNIHLRF